MSSQSSRGPFAQKIFELRIGIGGRKKELTQVSTSLWQKTENENWVPKEETIVKMATALRYDSPAQIAELKQLAARQKNLLSSLADPAEDKGMEGTANGKLSDGLRKKKSGEAFANPFKGLEYYDEADASMFFGRAGWLAEAEKEFCSLWCESGRKPFYGIVGGSGAGKSSLLRAGLVVRLKRRIGTIPFLGVVLSFVELTGVETSRNNNQPFSETPLGRLVRRVLIYLRHKPADIGELDCSETVLRDAQVKWAIRILIAAVDARSGTPHDEPTGERLVIGIDQFEELVDRRGLQHRDAGVQTLFKFIEAAVATGRLGFIYTCQSNRLALLAGDSILDKLVGCGLQRAVPFLTEDGIKEIVRKGFLQGKVQLPEGLISDLYQRVLSFADKMEESKAAEERIRDVQAALLPLISLTLLQLFEHCQRKRMSALAKEMQGNLALAKSAIPMSANFSADEIFQISTDNIPSGLLEVKSVITQLADRAMAELSHVPGMYWSNAVLNNLLRRFIRINGAHENRYTLPAIATPKRGLGRLLVASFCKYRLFVPVAVDQIRLVHEAVVLHWPPAATLVQNEKKRLMAAEELGPLAYEWNKGGRQGDRLRGLLDSAVIDRVGQLLWAWYEVFKPEDGTSPSKNDQLLLDFGLAALEAVSSPTRQIDLETKSASHFLIGVLFGKTDLIRRHLLICPDAAREERTGSGNNAAHLACYHGDLETMNLVVAHGADPIAVSTGGWQPIHTAAARGRINLVQRLIELGASASVPSAFGFTPLHMAALSDDLQMTDLLMTAYQANPNAQDGEGRTPLLSGILNASTEWVRNFLRWQSVDPALANGKGWTPLLAACSTKKTDIVRLLLDDARVAPAHKSAITWTPLALAVEHQVADIVELLLSDPRVDRTSPVPEGNRSIVEFAVTKKNVGVLAALLNDPFQLIHANMTNVEDGSPLCEACSSGQNDMAALLLAAGANPEPPVGEAALLVAATKGNPELVTLLLTKANPAVTGFDGRNALHYAAQAGKARVIPLLLKHIDPLIPDDNGDRPVHLALRSRSLSTLQAFLEVNPDWRLLEDARGRNALRISIAESIDVMIPTLLDRKSITARDRYKMTAIHDAARLGKKSEVHLLLETGNVDVNIRDLAGWTPLHYAAQCGNEGIIMVLLAHGADRSIVGRKPAVTALQAASALWRGKILSLLSE